MFKSLKGMPDILPTEMARWQDMEARLRYILTLYSYEEIRTPFLEPSELFARSIGAATDVVEKEMYSMVDKDGASISLRPEGTASVVRSYIENHLEHGNEISKLYYMGPMFRHERPQKGRLRQFYQVGAEIIGHAGPMVDADLLALGMTFMESFNVPEPKLLLNSVGDKECRPVYRTTLQKFLRAQASLLCENCQRRTETNPLRVFDCKSESCQKAVEKAPLILDHLCGGCKTHFDELQSQLCLLSIPFTVNPRIVRGLDYYSRTAFEIVGGGLGSQNAVLAGGRYDGLAEELGGKPTPAIGFAMGMERLLLSSQFVPSLRNKRVEMIPLDPQAERETLRLSVLLRKTLYQNCKAATVEATPAQQSVKGALRRANKSNATFVILIGKDEVQKKVAQVKNLSEHSQVEVPFDQLSNHLLEKLS